jgi:hypothetical protein
MRWMGHVACVGEMRNAYIFWLESLKGRGIDASIILKK